MCGLPGFTLTDRQKKIKSAKRKSHNLAKPEIPHTTKIYFSYWCMDKTIRILYNYSYTALSETRRHIAQLHGKLQDVEAQLQKKIIWPFLKIWIWLEFFYLYYYVFIRTLRTRYIMAIAIVGCL